MRPRYAIALHGGAGVIAKTIKKSISEKYLIGLSTALEVGKAILDSNGSALDAVEATVSQLENDAKFNAGKGSVFTHEEEHEMDASIMDGSNLKCGAVAGIRDRKNPIQLARLIMEKTAHVFLAGKGAADFADTENIPKTDQSYFYDQYRYEQLQKAKASGITALDHSNFDDDNKVRKKGTVGAVALDCNGNLAAATSTGGITNKKFGRIGDSPIIGAGNYANNKTAAISCTGDGEEFIRHVVAYDVHSQMKYKNESLKNAAHKTVHQTLAADVGGLIAIDFDGNIILEFNTIGMFRAWSDSSGNEGVKIWE